MEQQQEEEADATMVDAAKENTDAAMADDAAEEDVDWMRHRMRPGTLGPPQIWAGYEMCRSARASETGLRCPDGSGFFYRVVRPDV